MELPAHRLFDNKSVIAFLDINPLNPGHTLVIPKKHYRWVWDIPDVGKYFESVRHVAKALQKAMKTEMIVSSIFGIGESKWMHAHTHLLPRFPGDGHGEGVNVRNAKDIPSEEMRLIAEKIREELRKLSSPHSWE
jgi:histidine triad (HIT) family protein